MTLRSNVYQNWTKSKTKSSSGKPVIPFQNKSKSSSRYATSFADLVKELKEKPKGDTPPWDD